MNTLLIGLCDDEPAARSIISGAFQAVFSQHGVEAEILPCGSIAELRTLLTERRPELLILDIDIPELDGISFGKMLRETGSDIGIIFASNREDRVFDSLKLAPVGFVRKSCLLEDIPSVVDRFLKTRSEPPEPQLLIEARDGIRSIPVGRICYIESERNVQRVYLRDGEEPLTAHRKMQELEDELWPHGFIRVHNGFLVNYAHIQSIGKMWITLVDGRTVPISRRKIESTKSRFLELMQSKGSILA